MLTLGLGDVEQFPFIDPPDARMVRDGYKLLEELGAVSAAGALTDVGVRMARLPVDPAAGAHGAGRRRAGLPAGNPGDYQCAGGTGPARATRRTSSSRRTRCTPAFAIRARTSWPGSISGAITRSSARR